MSETVTVGRPRRFRTRRTMATAAVGLLVGAFGVVAIAEQSSAATDVASNYQDALVTIVSTEAYQGTQSAGTGMILSTDGTILTNNHVVEGATSIKVTVLATGRSYTASVVGTDATDDVAVIQLKNASGLETIPVDSGSVKVGDAVEASGNAGGTGSLSTVSGAVTATDQTITASDEGSNSETLHGLIETDADIQAGDSGGALVNDSGDVIGINTAASTSQSQPVAFGQSQSGTADTTGYAIPIDNALTIAKAIENGQASHTVTIGTHGFLGVSLQSATGYGFGGFGYYGSQARTTTGATIAGVVQGGAAANAGLTAGDTITAVNGKAVADADALNTAMAATKSGQSVTLTWTDPAGTSHSATVTLGAAPAA